MGNQVHIGICDDFILGLFKIPISTVETKYPHFAAPQAVKKCPEPKVKNLFIGNSSGFALGMSFFHSF